MLYRLVSQKISPAYWSHIFGGGARRSIRVEAAAGAGPAAAHSPLAPQASGETNASDDAAAAAAAGEGLLNTMTSITKQRVKLNIKVMHLENFYKVTALCFVSLSSFNKMIIA